MTDELARRIRILETRLRRSEENRARLEDKAGKSEELFRRIIHQMQDTESRLRASEAEAREAVRARSEFLANVTHEIRTPLMGVLGVAELLRDSGTCSGSTKHLHDLMRSAQLLRGIVDDILDYSNFEAGHMHLRSVDVDLRLAIEDAFSTILPVASGRGIALTCHIDTSPLVRGDPTRLRQVFVNLLGNAVKFTAEGSVRVEVTAEAAFGPGARITIIDTGIGFPPDAAERIFEPFRQEDGSTTRAHGGTGLGLAICRKIVNAHGGTIRGAARPEGGAQFTVILPTVGVAAPARPPEPAVRRDTPRSDMAVLLAEDNAITQHVITAMLELTGVEVTVASDGITAIELGLVRPFDLVLVDLHMPRADGLEVVQKLRGDPRTRNPATPIVAVTAGGLAGEVERGFAAGLNEVLYKPFNQGQLDELVARYTPKPLPVLDTDVFKPLVALLPTRVGALVTRFADDGEALIETIPTATRDDRCRRAHSGKGAARQLGAMRLGGLLERLEAQGEGPIASEVVVRLRREYAGAVRAMRQHLDVTP